MQRSQGTRLTLRLLAAPARRRALALAALSLTMVLSSAASAASPSRAASSTSSGIRRDGSTNPALVQLDDPSSHIYAMSDMHGHYGRTLDLLRRDGFIASTPSKPSAVEWTGGKKTLIVVGGMIDKESLSVQTLDLFRSLQESAARVGGRVIVTLGNHEADFLANPERATRTGDPDEVEPRIDDADPQDIANGTDVAGRGQWLRGLPLGVRVGEDFFGSSADTGGQAIPELPASMRKSLDRGFDGQAPIGKHSGVLIKIDARMAYGHKDRMVHIDAKKQELGSLGHNEGSQKVY